MALLNKTEYITTTCITRQTLSAGLYDFFLTWLVMICQSIRASFLFPLALFPLFKLFGVTLPICNQEKIYLTSVDARKF